MGATDNIYMEMKNIWKKVLNLSEEINCEMDFFEAGGNSLSLAMMLSEIKNSFEIELTVMNVFENSTFGELESIIEIILEKDS